MNEIMNTKHKLELMVDEELNKGKEKISSKELGEVVDMIKDLAEANYYCKITEAMDNPENQYGRDYDYRGRMGYMPIDYRRNENEIPMEWYDNPMPMTGVRYNMDGRMGYTGQTGGNMGNRSSNNYRSSGSTGRSGNSNSSGMNRSSNNSRYGYTHDDYMMKMDMYDANDPSSKEKRKQLINERIDEMSDMLTDTIEKMSPEEQAMWKAKLNKVINM